MSSRQQRLRPLQPVFDMIKFTGALSAGNSSAGFARLSAGTVTLNTVALVEHDVIATGTAVPLAPGSLTLTYTITGTASFDGDFSSGSTTITGPVPMTCPAGSILISYDPITDWVPA